MNFFSCNFPLREYFFLYFAPPPSPPISLMIRPLGKIFISLNSLEKSGFRKKYSLPCFSLRRYAVTRYAVMGFTNNACYVLTLDARRSLICNVCRMLNIRGKLSSDPNCCLNRSHTKNIPRALIQSILYFLLWVSLKTGARCLLVPLFWIIRSFTILAGFTVFATVLLLAKALTTLTSWNHFRPENVCTRRFPTDCTGHYTCIFQRRL